MLNFRECRFKRTSNCDKFSDLTVSQAFIKLKSPNVPQPAVDHILEMFSKRGDSNYGGEAVSQRQHAPDHGIDDAHEKLAARWLNGKFPDSVVAPVQLHVTAKRYLCTTDKEYLKHLSGPSLQSLKLQGGLMSEEELHDFRNHPHFEAAVRLRRWDEAAKDPHLQTPALEHFATYMRQVAL